MLSLHATWFLLSQVGVLEELRALVEQATSHAETGAILWSLLFISLSVTVGQSLLLLANGVKPSRFLFSLLFSALTFAASLGLWTLTIYGVGNYWLHTDVSLWHIFAAVVLSFTPLTHAYLGILPYLGGCIVRFLYVVSTLVLFTVLWAVGFGWDGALLVMVLGAIIVAISHATVLGPIYWLQNRVAGTALRRRYRDIIQGTHLELEV